MTPLILNITLALMQAAPAIAANIKALIDARYGPTMTPDQLQALQLGMDAAVANYGKETGTG